MQLSAQNWDINTVKTINKWDVHGLSRGLSASGVILPVGVPAAMGIYALIKKDQPLLKDAIYIGTSVIEAVGITYAAKHIQHRIGDPHKGADAQSRKAGGQHDGKAGSAAKYKVVGRTVKVQCYCIDDKSQIQQQKKACAAPQLCWAQVFAQAVLDRFHLSPDAPLHPSAG